MAAPASAPEEAHAAAASAPQPVAAAPAAADVPLPPAPAGHDDAGTQAAADLLRAINEVSVSTPGSWQPARRALLPLCAWGCSPLSVALCSC